MDKFYMISIMDYPMLYAYLGQFPAITVMEAYESAFGSVQVLAYEWDVLKYICDRYLSASEDDQRKFCLALEGQLSAPAEAVVKKAEKVVRRRERSLRFHCWLNSVWHRLCLMSISRNTKRDNQSNDTF